MRKILYIPKEIIVIRDKTLLNLWIHWVPFDLNVFFLLNSYLQSKFTLCDFWLSYFSFLLSTKDFNFFSYLNFFQRTNKGPLWKSNGDNQEIFFVFEIIPLLKTWSYIKILILTFQKTRKPSARHEFMLLYLKPSS